MGIAGLDRRIALALVGIALVGALVLALFPVPGSDVAGAHRTSAPTFEIRLPFIGPVPVQPAHGTSVPIAPSAIPSLGLP